MRPVHHFLHYKRWFKKVQYAQSLSRLMLSVAPSWQLCVRCRYEGKTSRVTYVPRPPGASGNVDSFFILPSCRIRIIFPILFFSFSFILFILIVLSFSLSPFFPSSLNACYLYITEVLSPLTISFRNSYASASSVWVPSLIPVHLFSLSSIPSFLSVSPSPSFPSNSHPHSLASHCPLQYCSQRTEECVYLQLQSRHINITASRQLF